VSDEAEVRQIVLARDVVTDVGILAAGTHLPAVPSLDGGWLLEMSLPYPLREVPSHPFDAPASAAESGQHLLNMRAAHHDYQFAREALGFGHNAAVAWIQHGYGATERQLFRWGLSRRELGEAS
jgi:hypothetical protein